MGGKRFLSSDQSRQLNKSGLIQKAIVANYDTQPIMSDLARDRQKKKRKADDFFSLRESFASQHDTISHLGNIFIRC